MIDMQSIFTRIVRGPTQKELDQSRLNTLREIAQRNGINPDEATAQFQLISQKGVLPYAQLTQPVPPRNDVVRLAIAFYVGAQNYDTPAQRLRSALGIARAEHPRRFA